MLKKTPEEIRQFCEMLQKEHLLGAKTKEELFYGIVNAPFSDPSKAVSIDLGIVVLLLLNNETGMLDRVALADTELAKGAVNMSVKRFEDIKIPGDYEENILIKAIKTGKPQVTDDWKYLFIPDLTPKQARFNQAGAGIECSVVHPLQIDGGGALIFSFFQPPENIGPIHNTFMGDYVNVVSESLSPSVASKRM